jgi:hypothetical protein
MIRKVYTVRDTKAEAYLKPFFMETHGLALRAIEGPANDPEHDFNRHKEDYSIWCIGEYEDSTGQLKPYKDIECLGKMIEYVKTNSNPKPSTGDSQPLQVVQGTKEEEGKN